MENDFTLAKAKFIENYNLAQPIMTILGDEVRQEILLTLIEAGGTGGIRVGDIQKKSHVSHSAVSLHLKVLLDAGIICMRREGTQNIITLILMNQQSSQSFYFGSRWNPC